VKNQCHSNDVSRLESGLIYACLLLGGTIAYIIDNSQGSLNSATAPDLARDVLTPLCTLAGVCISFLSLLLRIISFLREYFQQQCSFMLVSTLESILKKLQTRSEQQFMLGMNAGFGKVKEREACLNWEYRMTLQPNGDFVITALIFPTL
jgi:hypothetical protein